MISLIQVRRKKNDHIFNNKRLLQNQKVLHKNNNIIANQLYYPFILSKTFVNRYTEMWTLNIQNAGKMIACIFHFIPVPSLHSVTWGMRPEMFLNSKDLFCLKIAFGSVVITSFT